MKTSVTEMLGIEFPILAFSHCRDVVAAVSKAGGLGVLGAVGHSDKDLEIDLKWIEEEVGDSPYGVDLIVPARYAGDGEGGLKIEDITAMIPDEHRKFLEEGMKCPKKLLRNQSHPIAGRRDPLTPLFPQIALPVK